MNALQLFLPCAAGVEDLLADEVHQLTGLTGHDLLTGRGGVVAKASWRDAMGLNLHSRLAQRVLVQLSDTPYRQEQDIYDAARQVAWERWFTPRQTFKIDDNPRLDPLRDKISLMDFEQRIDVRGQAPVVFQRQHHPAFSRLRKALLDAFLAPCRTRKMGELVMPTLLRCWFLRSPKGFRLRWIWQLR